MVQIIPAVLATSEGQYQEDILKLSSSGFLEEGWVHIDFADNKFVQNKTVKPDVILKFPANFRKEAHLMVARPMEWIDGLVEAGFERIIIHIEAEDVDKCIEYIKTKGLEVGLAINNETPIEKLQPFVDKIDVVLVMTIKPGFQGQSFIQRALNKVRDIKSKNWPVRVGVDGAVKDDNIKEIVDAGVDFVIVGSYLLEGELDENLEILWETIRG